MTFRDRNKYFIVSILGLALILFSVSGYSQSDKKKSEHAEERYEADAAAVAYINCKQAVTQYYSESKPDDLSLQKELKQVSFLQLQTNLQVAGKYLNPAEKKEKFEKKVNSLKKELSTCIRYQNILDANEKLKNMKTQ